MFEISSEDYIEELRHDINACDWVKAESLLNHFLDVDEKVRGRVIFELSRADDIFAIPLLWRVIANHPEMIRIVPTMREIFLSKAVLYPSELVSILEQEETQRNPDLHLLALEAFFQVDDPCAPECLCHALTSPFADVRERAIAGLVHIGVPAIATLARNLSKSDPDLLVLTLDVLGAIGDEAATAPIRKLIHGMPENPNVRFAAYDALGKLPLRRGAHMLVAGLEDPVESVAQAALKAIDANLDDQLLQGVINLIQGVGEEAGTMVRRIIDSESDKLFINLVGQAFFRDLAIPYLAEVTHGGARAHFEELLRTNGLSEYASALRPDKATEEVLSAKKIWAVDDSKLILKLYKSALHSLGYDVQVFAKPEEAWETIKTDPPDFLFTDLNMPVMTGLELAKRVRRLYKSDVLPIVMVTTQEENQDHEDAYAIGVDAVVPKPFTKETLGQALNDWLAVKQA